MENFTLKSVGIIDIINYIFREVHRIIYIMLEVTI